jgi:archaellum component FlaC
MYRKTADEMIRDMNEQIDNILDSVDDFVLKYSELLSPEMKEQIENIRNNIRELSTDIELYWEE